MFKFNNEKEFEIRNENLTENIKESDNPICDVNGIDATYGEALLFF